MILKEATYMTLLTLHEQNLAMCTLHWIIICVVKNDRRYSIKGGRGK
jgi:hypothetical protein